MMLNVKTHITEGSAAKSAKRQVKFSPVVFGNLFILLASYRQGMLVDEVVIFPSAYGETGYYRCPRCRVTMEREFVAFCDRCGQHLNWKGYKKARKIYPGRHDPVHT